MRYYKMLNSDGTLNRIGTGEDGIEISKGEYDAMFEEIQKTTVHEFPKVPDEESVEM